MFSGVGIYSIVVSKFPYHLRIHRQNFEGDRDSNPQPSPQRNKLNVLTTTPLWQVFKELQFTSLRKFEHCSFIYTFYQNRGKICTPKYKYFGVLFSDHINTFFQFSNSTMLTNYEERNFFKVPKCSTLIQNVRYNF